MRKIFSLILFTLFLISGCNKSDKQISESKASEQKQESKTQTDQQQINNAIQGEVIEIKLPTMQCSTCKKNIETAVKKVSGVNEVKVSVKDKVANVNYDKTKADLSKIEGAIIMAGYQANDKPANKEAYDKLEKCCKVGGHEK